MSFRAIHLTRIFSLVLFDSEALLPTGLTIQDVRERNPNGNVYSGRGEHIKIRNILFRAMIHRDFPIYVALNDNNDKHEVALGIYQEVHQGGGRFLNEDESEMTERAAIKKIKRALTDAGRRARLAAANHDAEMDDMEQDAENEALFDNAIMANFGDADACLALDDLGLVLDGIHQETDI